MTSCTYGFYNNGIYKVDYVSSDAYPEGFGKTFVNFIRENTLQELHELEEKLFLVDRKAVPDEQAIYYLKEKGLYVKENYDWETISLFNEGFITYYIKDVYFVPDFCAWKEHQDWTYLINLDTETFDIHYFNKLVISFPLNSIPKGWYTWREKQIKNI